MHDKGLVVDRQQRSAADKVVFLIISLKVVAVNGGRGILNSCHHLLSSHLRAKNAPPTPSRASDAGASPQTVKNLTVYNGY